MDDKRSHAEEHRKTRMTLSSGFSLPEMLVSTSLFIVVVLVVVGALISLEAASRKARTIRVATDNVGAAIDSMSRSIRMGTYFHCGCEASPANASPQNCPMDNAGTGVVGSGNGGTCLAFEHQNGNPNLPGDQFAYRLSGQRIQRSTNGGTTWVDMTAPEINITTLNFYVGGTTLDNDQGYVTILVRGIASSTRGTLNTPFDIQTTVSQRTPNFDLVP